MSFEIAKREAVPLMIALSGPSGSGKTYSALMMAAGISGKNGKVGFIDTEAGRGSMYADDTDIINVMPDGKYYMQKLTEPFTPQKYMEAIKGAIKFGITTLVIDSTSHEWEGLGGCQDIAENNKLKGLPNWAMAKMQHKKFTNLITQAPIHIIFCLRAREKTEPTKDPQTGKIVMVNHGVKPIQEKNFMFDMTLSMMFDEECPGKPKLTKCPKPLLHLFHGNQAIVTQNTGSKLKEWADGGESIDIKLRNLKRECKEAAMNGNLALNEFLKILSQEDKELLTNPLNKDFQLEVRSLAEEADRITPTEEVKLFNNE